MIRALPAAALLGVSLLLAACGGGGSGGGGAAAGGQPVLPAALSGELVAGPLTPPTAVSSLENNSAAPVPVFQVTLRETGELDGRALEVTQLTFHLSGTADVLTRQVFWFIEGPGLSRSQGNDNAGLLTFNIPISIPDGDTVGKTYTISAAFFPTATLTDNQTYVLSINGATDLVTYPTGSGMADTNTDVTNGSGFAFDVQATELRYVAAPPTAAVAGEDFLGTLTLAATDANGYVDVDLADAITLSAYSDTLCAGSPLAGLASTDVGGLVHASAQGQASWSNLTFASTGTLYLKGSGTSLSRCSSAVQVVQASASGQFAGGSNLATSVDSLVNTQGAKTDLFQFTLREAPSDLDTKPLIVTSVALTTSQTVASDVTWFLNGPGAIDVAGVWSASGIIHTVTFSGLNLTVADGDTVGSTYTVSAYVAATPAMIDGTAISWSILPATQVITDPTGSSLMEAGQAQLSGAATYSVTATELRLQPSFASNALTGLNFASFPQSVGAIATDVNGNTDRQFASAVTLTAFSDSACSSLSGGTLASTDTGGLTHTPTVGVASWSQLTFSAWENVYLGFTGGSLPLLCSPVIKMGWAGPAGSSTAVAISRIVPDATNYYVLHYDNYSTKVERRLKDGTLDTSTGYSGATFVCSGPDTISDMAVLAGVAHVVGSNGPARGCSVDLGTGTLSAPLQIGAIGSHLHNVVTDGTDFYVFGWDPGSPLLTNYAWRIMKLSATGANVTAFGNSGGIIEDLDPNACQFALTEEQARAIAVDSTSLYLLGGHDCSGWRIEKRSRTTGALDTGFDTDGIVVVADPNASGPDYATSLTIDATASSAATAVFTASITAAQIGCRVEKRNASNGALDTNFGTGGVLTTSNLTCFPVNYVTPARLLLVDGTSLYIGGSAGFLGSGADWVVEKRDAATGALDTNFGVGGVLTIPSTAGLMVTLELDGSTLLMGGSNGAFPRMERRDKLTGN